MANWQSQTAELKSRSNSSEDAAVPVDYMETKVLQKYPGQIIADMFVGGIQLSSQFDKVRKFRQKLLKLKVRLHKMFAPMRKTLKLQ